jgi:hypothetical protein
MSLSLISAYPISKPINQMQGCLFSNFPHDRHNFPFDLLGNKALRVAITPNLCF